MKTIALALILAAGSAHAQSAAGPLAPTQETPEDRCNAALVARNITVTSNYCAVLAVQVATAVLATSRRSVTTAITAGAAQPRITDTPGAQSSAGQTAAVASGHPVATTGGSIAVVGDTGQGLQFVTALAINPASLAIGDTSDRSIWATRLADVSIVLPLEAEAEANHAQRFLYIGGRFRINTLAAIDPPELRDAVSEYTKLGSSLQALLPEITTLIQTASDPGKCASAIEASDESAQTRLCGAIVDAVSVTGAARLARAALSRFRERADRRYLTLEGRFDRGDLNNDLAKDTLLAAYLAGGYVVGRGTDGGELEFRARGGFVFFHDGATDTSTSAGYAAAGLEFALVRDLKRYSLSVAFELTRQRGSSPMPTAETTDAVRLGVAIPLDDGKVVSVGVTLPTNGGPSMIALSGDWSLLFGH